MRKIFTSIVFGLVFTFSFSQEKEIYLDDDFRIISKEEFDKASSNPFDYNLRFESDTTFVNIKVKREKEGKIALSLLESIKTYLSEISGQEIASEDALFINYYPGDGPSNTESYKANFREKYRYFYKKIEKAENIKQFSVYRSLDGIRGYGKKMEWLPDEKNLIKDNFYPIPYPHGGYIIINSDGTYLAQRGEYCYSPLLIEQIENFTGSVNNE